MALLILGFIGARITHVIYEEPSYYMNHPLYVLYFWYGGFVFYGGAFAGLLAGLLYCRRNKLNFLDKLNFFTPIFAVGYGLGRIACFISGCCYGKYCDLLVCRLNSESRYPTQLLAVGIEFIILGFLQSIKSSSFVSNNLFFIYVLLHSSGRLIMENFRDDFRGSQLFGMSISSFISFLLIFISIIILVKKLTIFIKNEK
jgi:phosphatidylglycerol:prolipoprotein diacylglycerol transferase